MKMLEVRNLEKKFGDFHAVKGISLSIDRGESFGLLGPNGAGKSTTIHMISGLFPPTAGEISVANTNMIQRPKQAQKHIGVVPQEIALYQTMSARDNLIFWGRMYGLEGSSLQKRVAEVLEIVGLSDRAKDRIETFSGGMKRRINIGAAILHHPDLLIMDEPTVGIDPQSRNHILETVKHLNQAGMTIIYTSHYMEEVEYLCTRIGIIDHGKLIACGTVPQLREMIGNRSRIILSLSKPIKDVEHFNNAYVQQFGSLGDLTLNENEMVAFHREPQVILSGLVQAVTQAGALISSVNIVEPNLENVFLHLTGRSLRE